MRHSIPVRLALFLAALLACTAHAQDPPAKNSTDPKKLDIESMAFGAHLDNLGTGGGFSDKKYRDFNEVTKGAERLDGLFTLFRKDDHLYAEIKPYQFDQPMLSPIAVAKGMAMAGSPLNFGDEWVLVFKRVGDKVQLIRRNIHYRAPGGTPLEKAVKLNYSDSILMALPIQSVNNSSQGVVVDLADIYMSDFGQLGMGYLDRSRSSFHKVKAFPNNLEIEVEATFAGSPYSASRMFGGNDDGVVDPRGVTLVIHYSLVKLAETGYRPRAADDRVGHFLSAVKDFGSDNPDTEFVRQINRWRLEKADPRAKMSAPKKQVVWWIEDTVPFEYRPAVEEGILEWNKAFEKVGIKNALAVRWQQDGLRDEFDPEDLNYCTFRWITTPGTFAMSCLRADPITGEMLDGDVIFDASWIKYWKNQYALLSGNIPVGDARAEAGPQPIAMGRVISPIMAMKMGYGSPIPAMDPDPIKNPLGLSVVPAQWGGMQGALRRRLLTGQRNGCQFNTAMGPEMGMAALALAAREEEVDKAKMDGEKEPSEPKLPDELLSQMIKEVVMHEVGHSLGLRHNFHASTMLTADQINDPSITRVKGMVASVMDYAPMNIAPKGQKQGDFITTTIGPYDYWAIEYAYKPIDGDEAAELKKIASRAGEPDLAFGTDDDMGINDPLVNVYDLGADPMRYAKDRMALAAELLKDIDKKVIHDGDSFARVRGVFSSLLSQWGNAAYLIASHVGGQNISRNHKADEKGKDPVVPVSGIKQREALKLCVDQILSDKAFQFSPALLRKLTTERWNHWGTGYGYGESVQYPVLEEVLGIQKIVLGQCLAADTLQRLQDQELMAEPASDPLKMSEVFRSLTDGIWLECPKDGKGDTNKGACSTIRRNLQREYLRRLADIVLGEKRASYGDSIRYAVFFSASAMPADAKSLARMHLREIDDRIAKALEGLKDDDTTRAHLEECRKRISRVLDARIESNEP